MQLCDGKVPTLLFTTQHKPFSPWQKIRVLRYKELHKSSFFRSTWFPLLWHLTQFPYTNIIAYTCSCFFLSFLAGSIVFTFWRQKTHLKIALWRAVRVLAGKYRQSGFLRKGAILLRFLPSLFVGFQKIAVGTWTIIYWGKKIKSGKFQNMV